jgi:hypothetical protein
MLAGPNDASNESSLDHWTQGPACHPGGELQWAVYPELMVQGMEEIIYTCMGELRKWTEYPVRM